MAKIPINLSTGSIQKEEVILGIDLGTTNSLIAFIDPENNPRVINDTGKGLLVPSVIHFSANDEIIIGQDAKPFLISDPKNTIFSVKRLLGRSYKDLGEHSDVFSYKIIDDDSESLVKVQVKDQFYTPIELSSLILKELKTRAEHAIKTKVNRVVITVPAYFNDSQRQATRDAGKLAGMDVLRIINEPTAASLAYGIGLDKSESKTIAVYDLGGGTFDISILKIENGIFEVLSTNGNTYLGGDDFDKKIIEYWIEKYNLSSLKNNTQSQTQEIRLLAEKAKIFLSDNNLFEGEYLGQKLELSKSDFEQLILPLVQESIECCNKAMQDAALKIANIDAVLLVGGSTRSPFVKKQVEAFFHQKPNDSLDPDQVVALGAAVQADILAGNRKDILLLDVTPLSLGIETMGGLMDVIIPRNSKIPTKHGRQYTTSKDGQGTLKISVYQGERDLVSENRKLAEFILNGIPGMPAGFPKIDIQFMLNADGILKVKATELRSGLEQSIEVVPSYGISDEVVEKMLMDSMLNAKEDISKRMILEAQNEGKQLVYTVENFLTKNGKLLSSNEIEESKKIVEELKVILEGGDKDLIHASIEKLNEYTRPFAEKVMDFAIAEAMKGKKI